MGRFAKLTHSSNPNIQEFIGQVGELSINARGGYDFKMRDNGKIISTSPAKPGSVLGDVDVPICRNIGFETHSGTHYIFDFMDVEKLHDGVRKEGNQFIGFEHEYSLEGKMNDASQRADVHNSGYNSVVKASCDKDFGY